MKEGERPEEGTGLPEEPFDPTNPHFLEELWQKHLPEMDLFNQSPISYMRKYMPYLSEDAIQLWGGAITIKMLQEKIRLREQDVALSPESLQQLRDEYQTALQAWVDRWGRPFLGLASTDEET